MRAGPLRNKAEIQRLGTDQNDFGEVEEGEFVKFKDVWCSITPIKGNESFLSNVDYAKTTHKIRIRYIDGVNASQRLIWSNRIFNFLGVINISERDKVIEILAEEALLENFVPNVECVFSIGNSSEDEGATEMIFTVTSTGDNTYSSTVQYQTYDNTAFAGVEYTETSGELEFLPGETSKQITVPLLESVILEDKIFNLILSNSKNATISNAVAIGTITNVANEVISYNTWNALTNVDNTRSFENIGDSGETDNAEMFTGRGGAISGSMSITVPINETIQTEYTFIDGVATFTEGTQVLTDYVIDTIGTHQDLILYDGIFTQEEKDFLADDPEHFLYLKNGVLTSDILNQSEIDNIVERFVFTDTDGYIRGMVEYSETQIIKSLSLSDFNSSNCTGEQNGDIVTFTIDTTANAYCYFSLSTSELDEELVDGTKYLVELNSSFSNSGYIRWYNQIDDIETTGSHIFLQTITQDGASFVRFDFISDTAGDTVDIDVSALSIKKLTGTYPIANYTGSFNATGLSKASQAARLVLDDLGRVTGLSSYSEWYGTETAVIPSQTRTVDISMVVNPSVLAGDILSGAVTLDTSGMTIGIDNNVSLLAQVVNGSITIGNNFSGTIKSFTEELA